MTATAFATSISNNTDLDQHAYPGHGFPVETEYRRGGPHNSAPHGRAPGSGQRASQPNHLAQLAHANVANPGWPRLAPERFDSELATVYHLADKRNAVVKARRRRVVLAVLASIVIVALGWAYDIPFASFEMADTTNAYGVVVLVASEGDTAATLAIDSGVDQTSGLAAWITNATGNARIEEGTRVAVPVAVIEQFTTNAAP